MTKNDIFSLYLAHKEELHRQYGLKRLGLFGSYARGNANEKSDVDIYAEFEVLKFQKIAGAWNALEQLFGKKVDLFYPHKNMRPALYDSIQQEVVFG